MQIATKYLPQYTYEDYSLWEGNWELINGIPYAMSPAPTLRHQRINSRLVTLFTIVLSKDCQNCLAYMPIDWKVVEDTVVQTDLSVICGNTNQKYLDFPPMLVAEILSPSTAIKDRNLKKQIYLSQGVKYYLILDPALDNLEIYEIIENQYSPIAISPTSFTFSLDEGCTADVNFEDIWK